MKSGNVPGAGATLKDGWCEGVPVHDRDFKFPREIKARVALRLQACAAEESPTHCKDHDLFSDTKVSWGKKIHRYDPTPCRGGAELKSDLNK